MVKIDKAMTVLMALAVFVTTAFTVINRAVPLKIVLPANFPAPVYDLQRNPVTAEGFELGRKLFYDAMLSKDGSVSCGSCHQQEAAFIQADHRFSHGVDSKIGRRNAMPVFNVIFKKTFFWDGGVHNLDLVPVNAITSKVEMDEELDNVLRKINTSPRYRELFKNAFGVTEISSKEFLQALSQFMAVMISANSRYDKYIRNEGVQLNNDEVEGLQLFRQKCSTCHATDLFTDDSFRNNGIANNFRFDKGREEITLNAADKGKFKVPTLRNIEFTAPYMHDGSIETLEAVLDHYSSGIKESATLDTVFKQRQGKPGLDISAQEKQKLIAFLKTLSDREFVNDKRFSEHQ